MTHDPATLAAVRERIASLRVGRPSGVWDHAWNAALDTLETSLGVSVPTSPDTRAAPPLTAGDVRRIVDERVATVLKLAGDPAAVSGLVGDALGKPPAPPPPAKRVEAWSYVPPGDPRVVVLRKPAYVRADIALTYLTTFPRVTDAASAEAFEQAVRGLFDAAGRQTYNAYPETHAAWNALAPFLPPVPR